MSDKAARKKKKVQHFFPVPILTYSVLIKLISSNSDTKAAHWMALFNLDVLI